MTSRAAPLRKGELVVADFPGADYHLWPGFVVESFTPRELRAVGRLYCVTFSDPMTGPFTVSLPRNRLISIMKQPR